MGSFAVLILCTTIAWPAPSLADHHSGPFDPSGDYHIADQALSAQVDRHYFDLEVRQRRGRFVAWGYVYARSTIYKIKAISVTRERLVFRTSTVRGIHYRFNGRFTRTGSFADQFVGSGIVAVEGTMVRIVNGAVDSSATSEYLYFPGC